MLKAILVNYNFTPTWLLDSGLDYWIYDRSDDRKYLEKFPQERIRYTENKGNIDYDKLDYLVEFYDNLPDVFVWGKTNMFKYVHEPDFWAAVKKGEYTPLLKNDHKTYSDKFSQVCRYEGGLYCERNDSWYVNELPWKLPNYGEFARRFVLPNPQYLCFAPGGNYILTKERVHRYEQDFYAGMRDLLPYCQTPAEAHYCERSYATLWN